MNKRMFCIALALIGMVGILCVPALPAVENTTRDMTSGSFGVAWRNDAGGVQIFDGTAVSEVMPGTNVYQMTSADLLGTGEDQLVLLDEPVRGLYVHDFKNNTTHGRFGNNVRTLTVGKYASDETFPSLVVCTFSGDSFRWTKEVMAKGWLPITGQFSAVSAGRPKANSSSDDFVVVDAGNVYIYSPKWDAYSKVAERLEVVSLLVGNVTASPSDEIVLVDKTGNLRLVQNRAIEDLKQLAKCVVFGKNGGGVETIYSLDLDGKIQSYFREEKTWKPVLADSDLVWTSIMTRMVGTGHELFAVSGGNLYRIAADGSAAEQLSTLSPIRVPLVGSDGVERASYRFGSVPKKPYVDELRTPSGKNILRDSPWDHVHHHAAMFAIFAGGCDFWIETTADCGSQITRSVESTGAAGVRSELDWCSVDSKTILTEERNVTVIGDTEVTLLDWATTLKPAGDEPVLLGGDGGHYFGFGLRFDQSMDRDGRFFNDTGKWDGKLVRGDEYLTPCHWMAYTAKLDGRPVTVALFDSPSNPIPMLAFTMGQEGNAFAYLSASLNLDQEPKTLEKGNPLTFRYRVAVWDGEVSPETIVQQYAGYTK